MDDKKIFDEMVNILKVYTKDPTLLEKATLDTHILNDLKVNSARLVDVIIKCEDVFGISVDDDEADRIRTIGDAVRIVKQKLG
jgi:acyl carrier protein